MAFIPNQLPEQHHSDILPRNCVQAPALHYIKFLAGGFRFWSCLMKEQKLGETYFSLRFASVAQYLNYQHYVHRLTSFAVCRHVAIWSDTHQKPQNEPQESKYGSEKFYITDLFECLSVRKFICLFQVFINIYTRLMCPLLWSHPPLFRNWRHMHKHTKTQPFSGPQYIGKFMVEKSVLNIFQSQALQCQGQD